METQEAPRVRVAVTGIGIYCPIGRNAAEVLESVRRAQGAIGEIRSFDVSRLSVKHAAEVTSEDPADRLPPGARDLGRTAQMAVIAASQAVEDAQVDLPALPPERVALVMGVCSGGRKDGLEAEWRAAEGGGAPATRSGAAGAAAPEAARVARAFLATSHFAQTDAVACYLGVHGRRSTISTACASSGSAIASAYELLQAGSADVVLAGGADAFSSLTYAGFYALGAMPQEPCSPFSGGVGVTFGEGAGFVVLEPLERAVERGATIHAELFGYGATADAYHMTSPDPSGAGLARAMRLALAQGGLEPGDIGYVNAHGTGTRDNDLAETLAVKSVFGAEAPPVSSTKSFFGHTLGAAAVLEFIVSILAMNARLLPPTLNFGRPRPGCDLDYVPNRARPAGYAAFLSNSAAFGGVNVALAAGRSDLPRRATPLRLDGVVITGAGVVSPVGVGIDAFRAALLGHACGIGAPGADGERSATVTGFDVRRLVRAVAGRRLDRLTELSIGAAHLALEDARLWEPWRKPERIGIVLGLTRGTAGREERFLEALRTDGIERLSPKHFPAMVLSTVAGEVATAFRLKGASIVIVEGATSGLHALVHAAEVLRRSDALDALLVVAADELGTLFRQFYAQLGVVAVPAPDRLALYHPRARGTVLGEGSVALVLERSGFARARGAREHASLEGWALRADSAPRTAVDPEGVWLSRAAAAALADAGTGVPEVDLAYGHGRGIPLHDLREARAFARLFAGRPIPFGCVNGNTGVAEAACGLYGVAAALLGLSRGEAYPILSEPPPQGDLAFVRAPLRGAFRRALVAGSTEDGHNAAVVLSRPGGK